jgi:hypothetical protein
MALAAVLPTLTHLQKTWCDGYPDYGPGVYSITIQTQWDYVHTGPVCAAQGRAGSARPSTKA